MQPGHITQPLPRLVALAPAGDPAAFGANGQFDVAFGGPMHDPEFDPSREAVDRFPAWLAAGIVVGLSAVFWVGLLTIVGWVI